MAGQPKRGLDFVGWNVRIFEDDTRIDELLDSQGWIGYAIYHYLFLKASGSEGYFYRWSYSNAATTARKMGGGIRSETVKQTVSLCLHLGLFDDRLFDKEGILTSKEIQLRYMLAIQKRSPSGRTIEPKYWLLNRAETRDYIIIPSNAHSLPEDAQSLPENDTKESKVNKSKVNESKGECEPENPAQPSPINKIFDLFNQICVSYPKVNAFSESRKKTVRARLNSGYTLDDFKKLFEKAEESDFLKGKNNRDWSANFDWIIKDANMAKVLDGNYDNKTPYANNQQEHSYDLLEEYKALVNNFDEILK